MSISKSDPAIYGYDLEEEKIRSRSLIRIDCYIIVALHLIRTNLKFCETVAGRLMTMIDTRCLRRHMVVDTLRFRSTRSVFGAAAFSFANDIRTK